MNVLSILNRKLGKKSVFVARFLLLQGAFSLLSSPVAAGPFDFSKFVTDRWRYYVSGYRAFDEVKSKKYGEAFDKFVKEAAEKLKDPKVTFDEFLKTLRNGSREGNKAATGVDNPDYGALKTGNDLAGGWTFSFVKDDTSYDEAKAKSHFEIIDDYLKFFEAGRSVQGPSGSTAAIYEVTGEGKNRTIRVTMMREMVIKIPNPPNGEKEISFLTHFAKAIFIENPNGAYSIQVNGIGTVKGSYKVESLETLYGIDEASLEIIMKHLAELYTVARKKDATNEEVQRKAQEAVIMMADLIRKSVPFKKGSSGIADALVVAFSDYHGWQVGPIRRDIGFDLKSWTYHPAEVIRDYRTYFDGCVPEIDPVFNPQGSEHQHGGGGGGMCTFRIKSLFGL